MKKALLAHSSATFSSELPGQNYVTIARYVFPEFISALLVYSLPILIDSYFVGQLESTVAYATLGATNNILYFITKLAESFAVGAVIIIGQYNGARSYENVGAAFKDVFWVACGVGICFAILLYGGAHAIYAWYGVPDEMVALGVPFLRMRAISAFVSFIYLALVGFLRGIKNTTAPMVFCIIGSVVFLALDYVLIFGEFGFPNLGLFGSGIAGALHYGVMAIGLLAYILRKPEYGKYQIRLFSNWFRFSYAKRLLVLSAPIMIDKATMAWSYIWLCKMINPMGAGAVAAYCVVRDIARCAFLPAMAGAQVITFLVSNDLAAQAWDAIFNNLKKVCIVSAGMVFSIFALVAYNSTLVIQFFDKTGEFTGLALHALPTIGVLVFVDLVQLILSGALRGAGNVNIVMYTRLAVCFGYFIPLSFLLAQLQIDASLKFILVYGSFYVGNMLMAVVYINRLRGDTWKIPSLKGSV